MSIPNPVTVTQATAPVVNISDITSGTVAGSGVFDTLMRAVNAQIESQYEQQRISGSDYSALYTEVLKHTMSLSVDTNFLKQKQAYELTLMERQIALTEQQINNLELESDNILKQGVLLDSQVNQILSAINMTKQQIHNLELEANNVPKQGLMIDKQTAQVNQQTANLVAESLNIPKQGLMIDTQTAAITKDIDLKQEQINIALQEVLIATAKLANIPKEGLLLDAEEDIKIKQLAVMDSQILNQDVQTELYNQKTLTEKANTDGTVIGTGSLLDAQRLLVLEQKLGFERDSIQKVSKLLMDAWAVRFNELPDLAAGADTALHNNNIEAVVEKLMNSVNVTPTAPPP